MATRQGFSTELIQKIRYYRLHEKSPSQTVTKINWQQILIIAEYSMISEQMARNYLYLIEKDIEFLKDFPDFLHRVPTQE